MNISTIFSPDEIAVELADRTRKRRLERNLSQEGLAQRSGVPLGTLKRFERTGAVSLVSFIRLLVALGDDAALDGLLTEPEYTSLDQVLAIPVRRMRGRIK